VAILSGRVAPPLRARLRDLGIARASSSKGAGTRPTTSLRWRGAWAFPSISSPTSGMTCLISRRSSGPGLAACPADAAAEVQRHCHFVCGSPGGRGAVREVVELLLGSRGRWDELVLSWEQGEAKAILDRSSRKGANRGDNS